LQKAKKGIWRGDYKAYNSKGLIDDSQTAQEKFQFCKTHDTSKSFSTPDAAQIKLNIESGRHILYYCEYKPQATELKGGGDTRKCAE